MPMTAQSQRLQTFGMKIFAKLKPFSYILSQTIRGRVGIDLWKMGNTAL